MAPEIGTMGNQFGKPDVERLGLFSEMPYMNGKGYVSPFPKPRTEKGRNIMGEGPKQKCGKQDCYFDKDFKRLFTGECIKGRGRKQQPSKFKNVSPTPFIPPGGHKLHSTPGDYYGTFSGNIEAFSNRRRPQPPFKHEPRNCLSGASKKGGYGVVDICINPYPSHAAERYGAKAKYKQYGQVLNGPMVTNHYPNEFFEPNPYKEPENMKPGPTYVPPKDKEKPALPPGMMIPTGPSKLQGGCHAGCFDNFPEHKPNKYFTVADLERPRKYAGGKFYPQSWGAKSLFTSSIISENVSFRVNVKNQANYEPTYIKHLVD